MNTLSRSSRRGQRRLALSTTVAALGLAGLVAIGVAGNVVLYPGSLTVTAGLTNSGFDTSTSTSYGASFNDSTDNLYASASWNGTNQYTLTLDGGVSYNSASVSMYNNGASVYYSFYNQALAVPIYNPSDPTTAASVNCTRPGGHIALHVDVKGADAGTTASLVSLSGQASSSITNESYSSYMYSSTTDMLLPAVANSTVYVYMYAYIRVADVNNPSSFCNLNKYVSGTVSLAEGQQVTFSGSVSGSVSECPTTGSVAGSVNVSFPSGTQSSYGYVYAYPGSASLPPNSNQLASYQIDNVPAGTSYPSLYLQLPYALDASNNPRSYGALSDYHQGVPVTAGAVSTANFLFSGAEAQVGFNVTGTSASAVNYKTRAFYGGGDSGSQTSSAYAYAWTYSNTTPLTLPLTPGSWNTSYNSVSFYDPNANPPINVSNYIYNLNASFTVNPGDTPILTTPDYVTSTGQIIFDVIEPPGSTTEIGISYPQLSASGGGVSMYASNYWAVNQPTPAVAVIGPPGTYTVYPTGYVNGNYTSFTQGTLTLTNPINTPTGSPTIHLPSPTGITSGIDLYFADVVQGGNTSATYTTLGPALPSDFTPINGFFGAQYVDVTTSAVFSGKVEIRVPYDPVALNLSPTDEQNLVLLHYVCQVLSGVQVCTWNVINESTDPNSLYYFGNPTLVNPDTVNHLIYGVTDSFSYFTLAIRKSKKVPPTDTCIGSSAMPAGLSTDPGVCSVTVNNTNQLAGGCRGGGGGLASCTFDGQASEALSAFPASHSVTVLGTANDGSTATCTSYVKVLDHEKPSVTCPAPVTRECTGPTTLVPLTATCSDNCVTCSTNCGAGPYAVGTTPYAVYCNAKDGSGNVNSCTTSVTVQDTTPPTLSIKATPTVLWPPNHNLIPINLTQMVKDTCDPNPIVTCSATASETGPGNHGPDIVWNRGQLSVRAERDGKGPGRTYTITCTAKDHSGNATTATATVKVPHNQ